MNIGNMNLNVDMYEAKNKLFQLHAMVKGYPEIKTKVKAATNLDPWGPTQAQMQEICDACNHYEDRRLVMRALWKRVTTSNSKEWPHVYKALAILEYLLLHGPESLEDEIRDQMGTLKALHDFQALDEKGQDKGVAIREKSKKLVGWLAQDRALIEERNKTAALQSKFVGFSSVGGSTAASSAGMGSASPPPAPRRPSFGEPSPPAPSRHSPASPPRARVTSIESGSFGGGDDTDTLEERPPLDIDAPSEDLFGANAPFDDAPPPAPMAAQPKPKAAPKAPAPRPAPRPPAADVFDPFGAAPAPAAPKPAAGLDDFFAAPAAAPFDPFAAPLPTPAAPAPLKAPAPAPSDDLFAPPPPASSDLFGSADPFGEPNPFGAASSPTGGAEKKTVFQDATFDQLCSLDHLGGSPAAGAAAGWPGEAAPKGAPQSLKAMRAQQAASGPPAASSTDSYNPFL